MASDAKISSQVIIAGVSSYFPWRYWYNIVINSRLIVSRRCGRDMTRCCPEKRAEEVGQRTQNWPSLVPILSDERVWGIIHIRVECMTRSIIEPRWKFLVTLQRAQLKYIRALRINQPTINATYYVDGRVATAPNSARQVGPATVTTVVPRTPSRPCCALTPFPVSSSLCSFIMATKGVTTTSINTPRLACLRTKISNRQGRQK